MFKKKVKKMETKKSDTFSICACHPCAGAMLIFSVSFQFLRMTPISRSSSLIIIFTMSYLYYKISFSAHESQHTTIFFVSVCARIYIIIHYYLRQNQSNALLHSVHQPIATLEICPSLPK